MEIPLYQVDAFTRKPFAGNPAAVCPLEEWPADWILQAIAAENNLSETAFFIPDEGPWALRWFTPATEVDLCGHATLASAHVIFQFIRPGLSHVEFSTRSGPLFVQKEGDRLSMDFPSRPAKACPAPEELVKGLGQAPSEVLKADDYLAIFDSERTIRSLCPDMARLSRLDGRAVIVTAPGSDCDFVSRFFAPKVGIAEDPVTGSAHCTLVPYWNERLQKEHFHARQLSARGGELFCEHRGSRLRISGYAVTVLAGRLYF